MEPPATMEHPSGNADRMGKFTSNGRENTVLQVSVPVATALAIAAAITEDTRFGPLVS